MNKVLLPIVAAILQSNNTAPVADAGVDQTVPLGARVSLDGSQSRDIDDDPLTFQWTLLSAPEGSTAALSDPTAVTPSLVADRPGSYRIQLVVRDAFEDSEPDTLVISTENVPPVADAGVDLFSDTGQTVVLDGSGSTDADGDSLSYAWTLVQAPEASTATVTNPTTVAPTLVTDRPGEYRIELTVNDGSLDSEPDTVLVVAGNTPPVADAGADRTAAVGNLVTLDGSGSRDGDGDSLTFAWSLVSRPEGSGAALSGATTMASSFSIDRPGTYRVRLVVSDGYQQDADTVVISTQNSPPVADAGEDTTARVGDVVVLDGSGSRDPESSPLGYVWRLVSRPGGSTAALADRTTLSPELSIDRPGTYRVRLVVSDGQMESIPDEMTITTVNSPPRADAGEDRSVRVNQSVQLDGTGSSDPDLDTLSFDWSILQAPEGSTDALEDAQSPRPTLSPQRVGTYVIRLVVHDGTVAGSPQTVTLEVLPPGATLSAEPLRGGVPLEVSLSVAVEGGFPPYSYQWDVNDDDVVDDTRASFVQLYQTRGTYPVTVTVTDAQGYQAQAEGVVEALVAPVVVASADPSTGTAPLQVAFSAVASDPDGAVALYEWDFNGDGIVDQRSPTAFSGSFRFETAGRYLASLTVTDDDGLSSTDTVVVSVGRPPELTAAATPLSGDAPLTVAFTATAVDPDGVVVLYEWDFQGDGVIDYEDGADGNTSHTYQTGGIYPATVNVYDDNGLLATRTFVVSVAGPPTALPQAFPSQGQAPLTVTFFSNGVDIDGSPEYYDWDFDGDGSRDTRLIASMNTTYTYTTPGTYTASLTVEDDDGLTGTAAVDIQVLPADQIDGTPRAEATASPDNGGTPLQVALIGRGSDDDGAIVEYAWDFENDGTFDFLEAVRDDTTVGQLLEAGAYASPLLLDLDGDGDRELLVGNSAGWIEIYTDISQGSFPLWEMGQFLSLDDETLFDVGSYGSPVADDLDGDGDQDLLVGNSSGQILLLENTGTIASPVWSQRDFLILDDASTLDAGSYAKPLILDYDGDGDRDLLIGNSDGQLYLYLRSGPADTPLWSEAGVLVDDSNTIIDVGSYAAPLLVKGSGLLVGNSSGQIVRLLQVAGTSPPSWQNTGLLQGTDGGDIDVGSYAAPVLLDLSEDDPVRLLVGDSNGELAILTETAAGWEVTLSRYNYFDVGGYADAVPADLDGDGDLDLLIGNSAGNLYLRHNVGTPEQANWYRVQALTLADGTIIDIGSYASPAPGDLDGDGDLDLLIGEQNGRVVYLRNDGDRSAALWTDLGYLTYDGDSVADMGSYAAPRLADIDRDGDLDLLVGNSLGQVGHYRNDGDASTPVWTWQGMVLEAESTLDVGSYAKPYLADMDANGTLDLLIGNSNGNLLFYENRTQTGLDLASATGPYDDLDVGSYAVPALMDMDGDADHDLLVGSSNGLVYLYATYGQVRTEYAGVGTHQALLRVTDDAGQSATATVDITVHGGGTPSATALATPTTGSVPLAVQFDGRSSDADGTIVGYEWDFDGDGSFDYASADNPRTSHTYTQAGRYQARLRVTDDDGLSSTDTVTITPRVVFETSITTATFDPVGGEQGAIETVVDGDQVRVTLRILDGQGNVVRTLVDGVQRGAGTYRDLWSGVDDNGQRVTDGAYYVVVEYQQGGETFVIDARQETQFEELTPSRSASSNFNPYEGQPVTVTYDVPWPAQVSLYFWTRDNSRSGSTIAPVRTLFLRQPRPAGSYTDIWDGFDDNGVAVTPGQQYPVTLWLYRLPDNVIMVAGNRPEIPSISVEPAYLNPSYNPYSSDPPVNAVVSLSTTKQAALEAQIVNEDGLMVRRITRTDRPAGLNTLVWDGRDSEGNLVAPGTYSIGVVAIDEVGNRSLPRYAAVTVQY